ncbi:DUF4214 domain-containing protein [Ramlibacter sp. WS9]|uniref:DUF4214 domain-containing protein n=1 Tax=Ramlibacter sp. WS9 TaxID=1882741 RepID=UPI001305157A|nr:DUF4214 domain-containing protein [Ramlibacter sp. WS9]
MSTTAAMRTSVSQLYVAMFGRAPDAAGLDFWTGLLGAGQSVTQIADTMFGVAPARNYFPDGSSNEQIIASFYLNVLGRTADAEGLAFWTTKLNTAGATPGSVIAEMVDVIAHYTGTNAAGITSANLFNNRAEAAQFYGENGGSLANATAVLAGVTKDDASVLQARVLHKQESIGAIDAGGYSEIVIGSLSGDVAISNVLDGSTLRLLTGSMDYDIDVALLDASGTADDLRVYLPGSSMYNYANLHLEGFERLQLVSESTQRWFTETVRLGDSDLEFISVVGTGHLYYVQSEADLVDASAFSGSDFSAGTAAGTRVVGSSGADKLTAVGSGWLEGRGGDDILSAGGRVTVVGGAGKDSFNVGGPASALEYVTIEDFTIGSDKLYMSSLVTDWKSLGQQYPIPHHGTWNSTPIILGAGATFQAYLDAAAASSATYQLYAELNWFRFGGSAYMVVNNAWWSPTFDERDHVVKFTGMIDLSQLSYDTGTAAFT